MGEDDEEDDGSDEEDFASLAAEAFPDMEGDDARIKALRELIRSA
jgi:hypothetical protein